MENIIECILTKRFALRYMLCTLHMQQCFKLQAIHFLYSALFFPDLLFSISNVNKVMPIYVYLLVNRGPIVSFKRVHSCLYDCVNVLYPPDAAVILPLQKSLTYWDRPFPFHALNLSFFNRRNEGHVRAHGKHASNFLPVAYARICT